MSTPTPPIENADGQDGLPTVKHALRVLIHLLDDIHDALSDGEHPEMAELVKRVRAHHAVLLRLRRTL